MTAPTYQEDAATESKQPGRVARLIQYTINRAERSNMNTKAILDNITAKEPTGAREKYIFLVGTNARLCRQIITARCTAVQATADEVIAYLDNDLLCKTHAKDYIWVPCAGWTDNDKLHQFLEREGVPYKLGWRMIKQLGDNPADGAVKAALDKFTEAEDAPAELPTYDTHKPHSASQYIDNLLAADIEKMKAAGNRKTGFPQLDKLCKGLYAGLYVLAATSSLGKTTLALQIADNLAEAGHEVLFFSLEQSRLEMITKSFSRLIKQDRDETVSSLTMRVGADPDNLKAAAALYKAKMGDRMSVIEGNFGCNIDYITEYISEYIAKNGCSPIIFIDYLQILQPAASQKNLSLKEAVDQNITALKRLSRDYGLTVFAISSVNRANYMQPIDFESLKESGGIEYTADVVWGLQLECLNEEIFSKGDKIKEKRARIREAKAANPRQIELVCLKNRYGVSNFTCSFEYRPDCDLYTQEVQNEFNPCYDGAFKSKSQKRL